jgi:AraC family transcriptional regulator of arabinose operon
MVPAAADMHDRAAFPEGGPPETAAPPPDVLVVGRFRERSGYAVHRRRGSGNWLLTYTIDGAGLYRQPRHALRTGPGDLVLLAPGAVHDYSVPPGGSWEFWWIHFQPRPAWLSWWRPPEVGDGLYRADLLPLPDRERADHAFRRIHADVRASALFDDPPPSVTAPSPATGGWATATAAGLQRELALNGLEEVLLLAARQGADQGRPPVDGRVLRVLDAIVDDLAAPHSLAALAQVAALSPSRLAHLFAAEVGDSVMGTVRRLRLRRAARLLESTGLSVGEVAADVGFGSAFHFSRQFRAHYGLPPRAYRAAHGERLALPTEARTQRVVGAPPPESCM